MSLISALAGIRCFGCPSSIIITIEVEDIAKAPKLFWTITDNHQLLLKEEGYSIAPSAMINTE